VYSADVIDCHRATKEGEASDEASHTPPLEQNDKPASAPTLPDNRAVIILIPVRLGGERTNPEYFDFAKVRDSSKSKQFFLNLPFNLITYVRK